jgi:hypothetical protein
MPHSTNPRHCGIGNRPLRADRQELCAPCVVALPSALNETRVRPRPVAD